MVNILGIQASGTSSILVVPHFYRDLLSLVDRWWIAGGSLVE